MVVRTRSYTAMDLMSDLLQEQGDPLLKINDAVARLADGKTQKSDIPKILQGLYEICIDFRKDLTMKKKVIAYQEGRINYLEKQLNIANENILKLEERQMGNNIIISGLAESDDEDLYVGLDSLFKDKLQIASEIDVDVCHRLGAKPAARAGAVQKPRPVVARLVHRKDKQKIYSNAKKLRGSSVFITDQHPDAVRCSQSQLLEQRKDVISRRPGAKVTVRGERLIVDGHVERDMRKERSACNDRDVKTFETAMKLDVTTSERFEQSGSAFQGHLVRINDPMEIKSAIARLCIDESLAKATHHVWAWRCGRRHLRNDNGELFASKILIDALNDAELDNVLVVCSRWYSGRDIGSCRFSAYKQAATAALSAR